METAAFIMSAETRYIKMLEEYFISVYEEKLLPSHGLSHHRRVWKLAKEIILLPDHHYKINPEIIPGLLIACFLHDIGMSVDSSPRHGRCSMQLCKTFLQKNNLNEKDFPDLLQAILDHDNKDYTNDEFNPDLLTILSVSDDLDAFGITGIYRYLEICITRRTNVLTLGRLIRENASKRFDHFEKSGFPETFKARHRQRYRVLDNFFAEYEKQVIYYEFNGRNPEQYCGIEEIISSFVREKKDLFDFLNEPEYNNYDPVIRSFFEKLYKEQFL
jgi:HD superfamily phosphodiesterase